MRYFELYRDLEIQNKILEFVLPFYEQVRLEEQRDTPSVIVLDTAIPADKPSKPRKLILSVVVLIVSFLLAYVLAFLLESFRRAKKPRNKEDEEKIAIIQQKLSLRGLLH
jgi:tyrosine-protein kinase Etk/Wzc